MNGEPPLEDASSRELEALQRIRIVLVQPSHPGNMGAAARALHTMGLGDLCIVAPQRALDDEGRALAAGGIDVLERAALVRDLDEAVADCVTVFGCTARSRTVNLPQLSVREAAQELVEQATKVQVALVFGSERTGLTNGELARCAAQVHIAANPRYPSLNLAAAVQIATYELRGAALAATATPGARPRAPRDYRPASRRVVATGESAANAAEFEGLAGHLERCLLAIDFFKGRVPDHLMRRLRRLGQRAAMTQAEVALVRGILSDMERIAALSGFEPRPLPMRKPRR